MAMHNKLIIQIYNEIGAENFQILLILPNKLTAYRELRPHATYEYASYTHPERKSHVIYFSFASEWHQDHETCDPNKRENH